MQTQSTDSTSRLQSAISRQNGSPEVSATWVAANRDQVTFIDVREPHELTGPLGVAEGAKGVPLGAAIDAVGELDLDEPIVFICRSGRRSAMAAEVYENYGYTNVASVEGGTLAWNLEVLHRHDIHVVEKSANADNLHDAIYRTNGFEEVSPDWVAANIGLFRLIDVRQPEELRGPFGRVLQAENVPLARLGLEAERWDHSAPLVVMCKSGGRSAMGLRALKQAGFTNVASMEGGMMGWAAAGLP